MHDYRNNAKWLIYFAPFKALSISAAYLVPFFIEKGLDQSSIFVLQSFFSISVVALEVPSGWLADRIGRALSIKLSAPIAAISMISYSFSSEFWQFILCELLLAMAYVMISGADQALLIDSLKASGEEEKYVSIAQRMHSAGFAAVFIALPISIIIVKYFGISSTLLADGILTGFGALIAWRLIEPPIHEAEELSGHSAWQASKQLFSHRQSRWLIALSISLSASTYIGAWVAAPYYESIGIPIIWFSSIYAARSLLKAWLSHYVKIESQLNRNLAFFVAFSAIPYFAMALGHPLLMVFLACHDAIHALQAAPLARRYNSYIASKYRAMLNSIVGMQSRLGFAIAGPLAGMAIDKFGLQHGLAIIGIVFGTIIMGIYLRLLKVGGFRIKE